FLDVDVRVLPEVAAGSVVQVHREHEEPEANGRQNADHQGIHVEKLLVLPHLSLLCVRARLYRRLGEKSLGRPLSPPPRRATPVRSSRGSAALPPRSPRRPRARAAPWRTSPAGSKASPRCPFSAPPA